MMEIVRNTSLRAFRVWQRNRDVYFRTWKINFIPPLLEPALYLVAFGAGIGAMVKEVHFRGTVVSYTAFIVPGMLATQAMFQSFFENTYNTYVRMHYLKTFDAIISTPLSVEDVMLGELFWGATKAFLGCLVMLLAISFFGLLRFPDALAVLPMSFVAGYFFASLGLLFTAFVPQIEHFNLPTFLFIMPMFLFSGTFFPLDLLPVWAQVVAKILPLTHVVDMMREATLGTWSRSLAWGFIYLAVVTPPLSLYAVSRMKRRMMK